MPSDEHLYIKYWISAVVQFCFHYWLFLLMFTAVDETTLAVLNRQQTWANLHLINSIPPCGILLLFPSYEFSSFQSPLPS